MGREGGADTGRVVVKMRVRRWSLIRALQPIATQVYNFGPASLTANGTIAVSEGRVSSVQGRPGCGGRTPLLNCKESMDYTHQIERDAIQKGKQKN